MICRAKFCQNTAIEGSTICGVHDEMAEDGEHVAMKRGPRKRPRPVDYLEREHAKKAAQWQVKKAEGQAKRDHAKEIILDLIAKRRAKSRPLCPAMAKKGMERCHFHAVHGNFCHIHKSLAEG